MRPTINPTVHIAVTFDGRSLQPPPALVAQYLCEVQDALIGAPEATPTAQQTDAESVLDSAGSAGAEGHGDPVAAQLKRLADYNPFAKQLLVALHEGLVDMGYQPRVPGSRGSTRTASYISYLDPGDALNNLGSVNSSSFTFMRKSLKSELADSDLVRNTGRYPVVALTGPEAISFVLDVAQRLKGGNR